MLGYSGSNQPNAVDVLLFEIFHSSAVRFLLSYLYNRKMQTILYTKNMIIPSS